MKYDDKKFGQLKKLPAEMCSLQVKSRMGAVCASQGCHASACPLTTPWDESLANYIQHMMHDL